VIEFTTKDSRALRECARHENPCLGNRRSVEKATRKKARSKSNCSGVLRQTWRKERREGAGGGARFQKNKEEEKIIEENSVQALSNN
jgi:hypothetical protein